MSWKNRIVGHGEQPAIFFMANPMNWRVHPKSQRDAISGILEEVGWVQSVIVNRTTGHVLDGHARIEEAMRISEDAVVPYVEVELTEEEEKKILLTLDPISAMAAADRENLDNLLREVNTASFGLQEMLSDLAKENQLNYDAQLHEKNTKDEFDSYDENIDTDYCCPKCGYKWSGAKS